MHFQSIICINYYITVQVKWVGTEQVINWMIVSIQFISTLFIATKRFSKKSWIDLKTNQLYNTTYVTFLMEYNSWI